MGYAALSRGPRKKHLEFVEIEQKPKTKVWSVCVGYSSIGKIRWRPGWRRYVFAPGRGTEYDADCMSEITSFVRKAMRNHKRQQKIDHAQKIIDNARRSK